MAGNERETALYGAVGVANSAAIAKMLLEAGADPNDEDALYHVAEFDNHDCIRLLFEYGVDPSLCATTLLRKLDFDDFAGVELLLELGVDPNSQGIWGKAAIHQAIMRGRSDETIDLLISHGADINATRSDGKSALNLAGRFGRKTVYDQLISEGAIDDLQPMDRLIAACVSGNCHMAQGIAVSQFNIAENLSDDDAMVLVETARHGNATGLQLLLDAGWPVQTQDEQGFTALHWASWYGYLNMVQLLLSRGAPLEIKNNYGGTVLDAMVWGLANADANQVHGAAVVEVLLQAGADITAVTPFPSGNIVIDELLRRYGAA